MSNDRKSWNLVVRLDTNNADKPYWHTIGRAWESDRNPGSIKIKINSLPVVPTTDFYLFPVRDEAHDERPEPAHDSAPPHTDDEIPF